MNRQMFLGGLILVMSVLMTSCEKTTVVPGLEWHVEDFFVDSWDYSDLPSTQYNNNYYFADYKWPSLTKFVYTDGEMQAYIVMNKDGREVQMPLPYVQHKETLMPDGTYELNTETYNVEYSVEGIRFTFHSSLFKYEDVEYEPTYGPKAHRFRVVLQW